MPPTGKYDFHARQGSKWERPIHWETRATPTGRLVDVDLSGYTARMQVRAGVADVVSAVLIDLTEGNGRVAWIDPPHGWLTVQIDADILQAIAAGRYVYDLELTPPSGAHDTFALLAGAFIVEAEVTR